MIRSAHLDLVRALVVGAVTCAVSIAVLPAQQKPPAQPDLPRPAFDTKTELVLVDVTVVDRDSNPVPTLTLNDFDLQVNGQPRKIDALQFVSAVPANQTPLTARESRFASNEAATTGRLLLFVVDESNLRSGSSRMVLRTAQTLMARLAPGDMIGLSRLPNGVGNVEFTADRERVSSAMQRITGSVDRIGNSKVRISEAYALENNDTGTWQQAVERECQGDSGAAREACADAAESDARQLLMETSARTQSTLRSLEALLKNLAALNTPVNIVMISEGLFVARDRTSMAELTRRAAEARATIHMIRPGQNAFDIEDRAAPGVSAFYDDSLMSEGLEQIAGQTRGTMTQIGGSPQGAFDRLGRELSGYYLVGFEPTDADRTGKERRIRVQVKPRGLTVRARPTFVVRDDAAATAPAPASGTNGAVATALATEHIKQLLVAPLPTRGLPMRVSTYTATDTGSSKIRVVISAEVGDDAPDEAEWPTGVLVLDKDGKVVVSRAGTTRLAPASVRGASPRLILTSVLLDPGEYTLRLAAMDDTGRSGSVHSTINARLTKLPGSLNVSDLVLVPQPPNPGETPRPRPTGVIDTETISAMIEMTGDQQQLGKAKIAVQIADGDNGQALVTVDARQAARGAGQRAFAATVKLGVLPPGEYVARAIITVPGQPESRIVRPFLLAPVANKATDEPEIDPLKPSDPDAPLAPPPPVKILAPVPRFLTETVLVPSVVRPFIDGLADLHPPSPGVEAVLEEARNGKYSAPESGANSSEDDELNLTFIRGLGALQKGDFPQAAAWFQQTLRGASDFLGAAFYLGATHAASGRDRDAVGAWQMALLSENPGAVYPALVDALLRLGDGRQAVEFIEEAPSAWADEAMRLHREATAEAMLGDYASALPKFLSLLETRQEEPNLLFVAIQVLYRMQLDSKGKGLDARNKALFADLVARHQKLDTPNKALVETWRKYVMR